VTTAWMFGNAGDHANAMCQLYRATRPSVAQLETLLVAMAVDGTGAQACDFDPIVDAPDYATLTRDDASRLLSAGYGARLLGTHPLEDAPVDVVVGHLRRLGFRGTCATRVAPASQRRVAAHHRTNALARRSERAPRFCFGGFDAKFCSSRPSDTVSALLVDASECDHATIAKSARVGHAAA